MAVSVGYGAAAAAWVVAGEALPGGRWLAVHLFTLGVVTNVVLALSDHFARTLTHQPGRVPAWQLPTANAGVLCVLAGRVGGWSWAVVLGATVLTAVVFLSYRRLRHMRRRALAPRFGWIVRMYERAHGAFIHGAVLGAILGTGAAGRWYVPVRTAHLHVNLLGWAGLTLLATMVFFGPTVARAQIGEGREARARRALGWGATGLTAGVVAILGSGIQGTIGVVFRSVAAAGLATFAWSVSAVSAGVVEAVRRARPSPQSWAMLAASCWFPAVAWADVAVIAFDLPHLLDPLGAALVLGVLVQLIQGSMTYLTPLLIDRAGRERVSELLAAGGRSRVVAWNLAVALAVVGAVGGSPSGAAAALDRVGWGLAIALLASQAVLAVLALLRAPSGAARSTR